MEQIIFEIKQQVPVDDEKYIYDKYIQNNSDISETILDILNCKENKQIKKKNNIFSELRMILDDKDRIYHQRKKTSDPR